MASGPKYATFFREELLEVARGFFPLSDRRQDNFIAGLSMGGYGALYLALSQPERYAAAASLSGAVDVANIADGRDDHWRMVMQSCFGDFSKIGGGPSDLFAMTRKLVRAGKKIPAIYSAVGWKTICCRVISALPPTPPSSSFRLPTRNTMGSVTTGTTGISNPGVLQWLPLKKWRKSRSSICLNAPSLQGRRFPLMDSQSPLAVNLRNLSLLAAVVVATSSSWAEIEWEPVVYPKDELYRP